MKAVCIPVPCIRRAVLLVKTVAVLIPVRALVAFCDFLDAGVGTALVSWEHATGCAPQDAQRLAGTPAFFLFRRSALMANNVIR